MVLSGFPRLSETFAIQEVLALYKCGLLAALYATKHGDPGPHQPDTEHLMDMLHVLPQGTPCEQASDLVKHADGHRIQGLHAYFAHLPLEVAAHAARELRIPFGFSAHARDVRKVSTEKLHLHSRSAICAVACNRDVRRDLSRASAKATLIPHGVDTDRFRWAPQARRGPLRILAVGRLVEKKGFEILIRALALIDIPFQFKLIGAGPLEGELREAVRAFGIERQVDFQGKSTHHNLPDAYRNSDIVVVPSVIDRTGDRDGLPNVVLEGMAAGCTVIATDVGDMRAAVVPDQTGLLVPPGDPEALAQAISELSRDAQRSAALARCARQYIKQYRSLDVCTHRFCTFLESTYGAYIH